MKRYYFGLRGGKNVEDRVGLPFEDDLQAFQAGERLAAELSEIRPELHGNTCVAIDQAGIETVFYVSICDRQFASGI
jgi:hypothetical protein